MGLKNKQLTHFGLAPSTTNAAHAEWGTTVDKKPVKGAMAHECNQLLAPRGPLSIVENNHLKAVRSSYTRDSRGLHGPCGAQDQGHRGNHRVNAEETEGCLAGSGSECGR